MHLISGKEKCQHFIQLKMAYSSIPKLQTIAILTVEIRKIILIYCVIEKAVSVEIIFKDIFIIKIYLYFYRELISLLLALTETVLL